MMNTWSQMYTTHQLGFHSTKGPEINVLEACEKGHNLQECYISFTNAEISGSKTMLKGNS